MNTHRFTIDLEGVITVLGENLYSTPQVYIRELLQNAVDAIRMREGDFDPAITLTYKSTKVPQLIFRDNGTGLTEKDIHQFLATIGSSSKRDSDDHTLIGRFGIGLLSAFVVSDTITVHTRSVQTPTVVTKWVGKKDGTYTIATVKKKMEIGTEVTLKAASGMEEYYEPKFVEEIVRHFGDFLPFPIRWNEAPLDKSINRRHTPIEVANLFSGRGSGSEQKKRESLLAYGKERFDVDFLDAFEITSAAGNISGVAYVLPYSVQPTSQHQTASVYLKRMLLNAKENQLVPDWAFFLQTLFFVDDLTPTASREGFQIGEKLTAARKEIGDSIIAYLSQLAKHKRSAFDVIIRLHDVAFKALALENEHFYKEFVKLLPFETSMGRMLLEEYLAHSTDVRFTTTIHDFYQMSAVANAEELWIINGGYVYESEILSQLPNVFSEITSEVFQATDIVREFEALDLKERNAANQLVSVAQEALAPFECGAAVRKFSPHALPAMYVISEQGKDRRAFQQVDEHVGLSDHLREVLAYVSSSQPTDRHEIQICFNWNNELVQKLSAVHDKELTLRIVRLIYVQALLQAQKPLRPIETAELNVSLSQLIDQVMKSHG